MLAIIISPYNAPTPEARAANVRLGIALARWSAAQGYTPVGWWCDVDPANPESDADPVVRAAALARSAERARMVGAAGGMAVLPAGPMTSGMMCDYVSWCDACGDGGAFNVSLADLAPYLLPEVTPTVPRAAVQAAVDEIAAGIERIENNICNGANATVGDAMIVAYRDALGELRDHTGVTPTEVQP
jgi:hypothetical protein